MGSRGGWTPARSRKYKEHVAWYALAAVGQVPGWTRTGRFRMRLWVRLPDARTRDLSNVIKAVEDACNRIVYEDDGQIDELHAVKEVDRERPGLWCEVSRLPADWSPSSLQSQPR